MTVVLLGEMVNSGLTRQPVILRELAVLFAVCEILYMSNIGYRWTGANLAHPLYLYSIRSACGVAKY